MIFGIMAHDAKALFRSCRGYAILTNPMREIESAHGPRVYALCTEDVCICIKANSLIGLRRLDSSG